MTEKEIAGLEKALELSGGEYSVGDVVQEVLRGDAQSWATEHAWIITRVIDAPRLKTLHFWLASGEMDEVLELSERVMDWARSIGCAKATMHGRLGWVRVLKKTGWSAIPLVALERELGNGQG